MLINILTPNNNPNSFSFIFPFLANKKGLLGRGIKFRFLPTPINDMPDCDAVFIDSKSFKYWWKRGDNVYRFLSCARKSANKVIWFDTSDSTGTPQFQVLPYVDAYYKNQVLKDKKLYLNKYYRDRIYFDYYHKNYGISDDAETGCESLPDPQHIDKIDISWNPALNDHGFLGNSYSLTGKIVNRLKAYLPIKAGYTARFTSMEKARRIDIACRMGLSHSRSMVGFHRKMLLDKLKVFNVNTRFVSHSSYYGELGNAKLSISPFGLGEITYKDFETILRGAVLVKPDMDHVDTWPNIYKKDETYVGCRWDFSDLEEKIKALLSDAKRAGDIAKAAQKNYSYYLFGEGRNEFCDRISGIINRQNYRRGV